MTDKRLEEIRKANAKYNKSNTFIKGGGHGRTGVNLVVSELIGEIEDLNILLEGHKDVVSEYAQTILVLRNKLEIVESSLSSATKRLTELEEDLPMIGESKYAKRTRR